MYPIIPLVGIVGSTYIIISTLITNTSFAIYGSLINLLGLPGVYLFFFFVLSLFVLFTMLKIKIDIQINRSNNL